MHSITNYYTEIATFIFCVLFIIQIVYHVYLYGSLNRYQNAVYKGKIRFETAQPPVSVILRARDDLQNLKKNLPLLLEQDYSCFEVIVINDNSSDETENFLKLMETKYDNLYHTFTSENTQYISRKKLSLTIGIKASKYDWLVFTETNCYPASKNWLALLARNFTPSTDIVLGYSGYEPCTGQKNYFKSYDSFLLVLRYLGFALIHKPYMGTGRNMAYRKELFFKNKGYSSHLNLKCGEDDIFINETANSQNTRVEIDKGATVKIQFPLREKRWKEEKLNYLVTSRFYKGMQRHICGLETFTRIAFYILFILTVILCIMSQNWFLLIFTLLLYIVRWGIQAYIIQQTSKNLAERKYVLLLPLLDIWQPLKSLQLRLSSLCRPKKEFMRNSL